MDYSILLIVVVVAVYAVLVVVFHPCCLPVVHQERPALPVRHNGQVCTIPLSVQDVHQPVRRGQRTYCQLQEE